MSIAQRILLFLALLLFAANTLTAQTTWTGNISTDWNTAGNWTAGVPTNTSNVIIPDVTNDPVINTATTAAKFVQVDTGGLLTISNTGILTINDGASGLGFDNLGTVQNNGTIAFKDDYSGPPNGIRNQGVFNNNTGAIITIYVVTGTGLYNYSGTFFNAGTLNIGKYRSTGSYSLENDATFVNTAGGQLWIDCTTNASIYNKGTFQNYSTITIGYLTGGSSVHNAGTNGIQNEGAFNNNTGGIISLSLIPGAGLYNYSGTFTNAGTINMGKNGAIRNALKNYATFNNNTGAEINTQTIGDSLFCNYSGTFSNAGTLNLNAGPNLGGLANYATFKNNAGGLIRVNTIGAPHIHNKGTFQNNSTITIGSNAGSNRGLINEGPFNNNTGGIINIDRIQFGIALYNLSSIFTNAGTIAIGAKAATAFTGIRNEATFNNTGGQINIDRTSGTALSNAGGTFTNIATISIGANAATGKNGIDNNGLFNNNAGGQIRIDRVTNAGINNKGLDFSNAGTIYVGSLIGGNTINYGIYNDNPFNNTVGAQINIDNVNSGLAASTKTINNWGTVTIGAITAVDTLVSNVNSDAGIFSNNEGGIFKGTGIVDAARFVNAGGTLAPGYSPGTMTFTGDETFSNNTLNIEVSGTGVAGTDFDQVVVNGTATLGDALVVAMNYFGNPGDQVTILNANAISGTFATVKGLPSYWKVIYTAKAVILECEGRNSWTGNISQAWNTAGNWSKGTVPGPGKDVLLPATGVVRELTVNYSISTGSIEIATGRTVTIGATGKFGATSKLINNGTIKGTGAIVNANFTNTGILAPGNSLGILSITGNLINQGVIQTEIGGTNAGTQYDQLAVSGAVTIGGTLAISTINGFHVAAGQTYTIITGATVTGSFTSVTWPTGVRGTVTYSATTVTLKIHSVLPLAK